MVDLARRLPGRRGAWWGLASNSQTANLRVLDSAGWSIWRDGCPDGEAPADVAGRADRLIARLLDLEGPVALFSHGHLCTALALRWLGLALVHGPHFPLSPASLSLLTCALGEPDRRVLGLWNEVAHPSQCEGPISHGRGSAERST